jgi:hypothetical protein
MLASTKRYEVAVHNEEVRRLVQRGERHRHLQDTWADTHYVTLTARDAMDARRKAMARYPEDKGFVIEQISLDEED